VTETERLERLERLATLKAKLAALNAEIAVLEAEKARLESCPDQDQPDHDCFTCDHCRAVPMTRTESLTASIAKKLKALEPPPRQRFIAD
jgi:hypothetical protein